MPKAPTAAALAAAATATATAVPALPTVSKRPSFSRLQSGHVLAEVSYYTVHAVDSDTAVLKNAAGRLIKVSRGIIEQDMTSANQVNEEREVSLTEAVGILQGAGNGVFTVNYHKKADRESIAAYAAKYIDSLGGAIIPALTPKQIAQIVNEGSKGEERTLVGHLVNAEPMLGRSQVIDLQLPPDTGHRLRLVDHRTINWLIFEGIKYNVKK